jgi:prepilin-type N-terminal cleavage/methylation domain-containing protein
MINNINNKRNGFTLVELAIVILIIWLLSTLATPYDYHRPNPKRAIQKQCFSNQRLLQGAIEMYNMDHSIMLDKAFPGYEADYAIRTLEEDG